MKLRRDIVFVGLAIICLTATLFMVKPTISQSANEYDPWTDLNDDGKIDIFDLVKIALAFGTEGDPIDKTALLIEVNATFANLQSRMDALNSSLLDLWDAVNGLNYTNFSPLVESLNSSLLELQSRVTTLETNLTIMDLFTKGMEAKIDALNASLGELGDRVTNVEAQVTSINSSITQLENLYATLNASVLAIDAKYAGLISSLNATITGINSTLSQQIDDLEIQLAIMNATKLGIPDWNTSGWYGPLAFGDTVFNHGLNLNFSTTDVLVYMIGRKTLTGSIQQKDYGGWQQSNGNWYGAYWYLLTENTITVHRHGNDGDWVYVRMFIWKIPK